MKNLLLFFESKTNNSTYVTMTSQQMWYWALDYLNNKISFCTVCTVAKFVLEVCVSINLAHVK